jgi:hypothetical protein
MPTAAELNAGTHGCGNTDTAPTAAGGDVFAMTFEIGLLFAFVLVALVLFATEWVEADVTALGLLMAMVLTGLLPASRRSPGSEATPSS